eukprot:scaffold2388_cov271-Prasinococcus_capsulatus_cf.AAC.2
MLFTETPNMSKLQYVPDPSDQRKCSRASTANVAADTGEAREEVGRICGCPSTAVEGAWPLGVALERPPPVLGCNGR